MGTGGKGQRSEKASGRGRDRGSEKDRSSEGRVAPPASTKVFAPCSTALLTSHSMSGVVLRHGLVRYFIGSAILVSRMRSFKNQLLESVTKVNFTSVCQNKRPAWCSDRAEPIAQLNRCHSAMEKLFEHEGEEALSWGEFAQRYSAAEAGEKWQGRRLITGRLPYWQTHTAKSPVGIGARSHGGTCSPAQAHTVSPVKMCSRIHLLCHVGTRRRTMKMSHPMRSRGL